VFTLATVPAVQKSRALLHVRGNWPARDDRVPSAIWLAILWIGMIAGFGVDISGFRQAPYATSHVIWVHAFVFAMWMVLLTAQVLLVLRNRVASHRRFGWVLAGWACLMAVLGPWAAIVAQVVSVHTQFFDPPFLSVNFVDIAGFLALLAWGISLRKNPAAHRRMMILATVALADPGFSRFSGWLWPAEPSSLTVWFFYVFYGNVLLVALMAAWDCWRGRLMRSFVVGAAALLASEVLCSLLYFWGPWKSATSAFIRFCANSHI
jgi:hypothetical protein